MVVHDMYHTAKFDKHFKVDILSCAHEMEQRIERKTVEKSKSRLLFSRALKRELNTRVETSKVRSRNRPRTPFEQQQAQVSYTVRCSTAAER
jgi:plasmid rolling circle replication initiator protein Rep